MNLSKFETMDPHLLFGLVNTALRNDAEDLEDLAKTHGIDRAALETRLREAGYDYDPEQRQFR